MFCMCKLPISQQAVGSRETDADWPQLEKRVATEHWADEDTIRLEGALDLNHGAYTSYVHQYRCGSAAPKPREWLTGEVVNPVHRQARHDAFVRVLLKMRSQRFLVEVYPLERDWSEVAGERQSRHTAGARRVDKSETAGSLSVGKSSSR
jgi:hypothetical protein